MGVVWRQKQVIGPGADLLPLQGVWVAEVYTSLYTYTDLVCGYKQAEQLEACS